MLGSMRSFSRSPTPSRMPRTMSRSSCGIAAGLGLSVREAHLEILPGDRLGFVIRPNAHAGGQLDLLADRAAEQLDRAAVASPGRSGPTWPFRRRWPDSCPSVFSAYHASRSNGIAAENSAAQRFLRRALEGFVDPVVRRLAPTDQAVIRLQADEQRFLALVRRGSATGKERSAVSEGCGRAKRASG